MNVPGLLCTSNLAKLEDLKKELRCLLISMASRDVTLRKLNLSYKELTDEDIPFKSFGYSSLKDLCADMPEVLSLKTNKRNELCAYHIDTEKSQHISSLIAKQKKGSDKFKKSRSMQRNNKIDPRLLYQVLRESVTEACQKNNNTRISKQDVLSKILNRIGVYAFYTVENLNNQLHEFTHLLNHDENYIYFKKGSLSDFNNNSSSAYLSNLIKDSTKNRLQKLIEKHPNGIWCSDFPKTYEKEYGMKLEYYDIGFCSIIEFIAALPKIFKIVTPPNCRKHKIIDARKSSNYIGSDKQISYNFANSTKKEDNFKAVPTTISKKTASAFFPQNAMGFDDQVNEISVTELVANAETYLDVEVVDLVSPSQFWVVLSKNNRKFVTLMDHMQEFYGSQKLDDYKIPPVVLKTGLFVACIFDGLWYRCKIDNIKTDGVDVFFCDYGTKTTYQKKDLYFLDRRFSKLPAQSISCSMYNVKPIEKESWPFKICKAFEKRVFPKSFAAEIHSIDEKNNMLTIDLLDTRYKTIISISEWMIRKNLAVREKDDDEETNSSIDNYKNDSQGDSESEPFAESKIVEDGKKFKGFAKLAGQKVFIIENDKNSFLTGDCVTYEYPVTFTTSKVRRELKKYMAKLANSFETSDYSTNSSCSISSNGSGSSSNNTTS